MTSQERSCTRNGVPRKNQMYAQAEAETIGTGERRITARITPITAPMTMAIAVSSRVTRSAARMVRSVKYCPTTCHSNRGFLTMLSMAAARMIRTTAVPIHRPGWRAGIALIRSAGTPVSGVTTPVAGGSVRPPPSAHSAVYHGVRDGPGLHAPLHEDLHVGTVGDQFHEGVQDGLRHRGHPGSGPCGTSDRDAVGRHPIGLSGQHELAVGQLHLI